MYRCGYQHSIETIKVTIKETPEQLVLQENISRKLKPCNPIKTLKEA